MKAKHLIAAVVIAGAAASMFVLYRGGAVMPAVSSQGTPLATTVSRLPEDKAQVAPAEGPHFDYPTVEAEALQSEILHDFGGFDSPMRSVTVLDADGRKMEIVSAFNRNFTEEAAPSLEWKITQFADLNAAFTEIYRIEAGTTADGAAIHLHVGEFAQDGCGPLTTVYTVESKQITSFVGHADVGYELYGTSGCTIGTPTGDDTCESRASCVQKHLQQLSTNGLLESAQLRRLRTLRVH